MRRAQIEAGRVTVENSALETNFPESTEEDCVEIHGFNVENLN